MDSKTYSKYFKAFGDPSRLKILGLLSDSEMTVNEIAGKVGLAQPTVSRHLGVLRDAEIVIDRREGQQVFYSLNKTVIMDCCCSFCDCLEVPIQVIDKRKKTKKK